MTHRPGFVGAVLAALALNASPAAAQFAQSSQPRFDVGVGFTMQAPPDVNMRPLCEQMSLFCSGSGRTFPDFGIGVAVGTRVTGPVYVVGDVNVWGNAWRVDGTAAGRRTNQVFTALTGFRVRSGTLRSRRDLSTTTLFGQLLVGGQAATEVPGRRVWQPGAGMDVHFSRVGFRIELDYMYSPGPGRNLTTGRGFMGIVINAG